MEWPEEIDLRKFPNGMISGMTLEQIVRTNEVDGALPNSYDYDDLDDLFGITEEIFTGNEEHSASCASSANRFAAPTTSREMQIKKENLVIVPKGTKKRDT